MEPWIGLSRSSLAVTENSGPRGPPLRISLVYSICLAGSLYEKYTLVDLQMTPKRLLYLKPIGQMYLSEWYIDQFVGIAPKLYTTTLRTRIGSTMLSISAWAF